MIKDKDEIIIAALLSESSYSAAAKKAKVSRGLLYERLSDPDFKAKYQERRLAILDEATARLQSCLCECIDEIKDIATDSTNSAQIRLNACDMIIRNALKLNEQVAFAERLSAIEARLAE